jgi:hypothetical protein
VVVRLEACKGRLRRVAPRPQIHDMTFKHENPVSSCPRRSHLSGCTRFALICPTLGSDNRDREVIHILKVSCARLRIPLPCPPQPPRNPCTVSFPHNWTDLLQLVPPRPRIDYTVRWIYVDPYESLINLLRSSGLDYPNLQNPHFHKGCVTMACGCVVHVQVSWDVRPNVRTMARPCMRAAAMRSNVWEPSKCWQLAWPAIAARTGQSRRRLFDLKLPGGINSLQVCRGKRRGQRSWKEGGARHYTFKFYSGVYLLFHAAPNHRTHLKTATGIAAPAP